VGDTAYEIAKKYGLISNVAVVTRNDLDVEPVQMTSALPLSAKAKDRYAKQLIVHGHGSGVSQYEHTRFPLEHRPDLGARWCMLVRVSEVQLHVGLLCLAK